MVKINKDYSHYVMFITLFFTKSGPIEDSFPPLSNRSKIDMASYIVPHRVPSIYLPDNCCCRRIPLRINALPSYP